MAEEITSHSVYHIPCLNVLFEEGVFCNRHHDHNRDALNFPDEEEDSHHQAEYKHVIMNYMLFINKGSHIPQIKITAIVVTPTVIGAGRSAKLWGRDMSCVAAGRHQYVNWYII